MTAVAKTPKVRMAIALLAIFLTSLFHAGEANVLLLLFLSIIATIGSDFLFLKLRGKPLFSPSAAAVSGIIIALLIPPNSSWYQIFLPGLLAMFSKNFIRVSERHIFNPAALGLLISGIILKQNISWWGVSWQQATSHPLAFIILLTPFLVSALRMRRYFIQLSFFILFVLLKISILDPTLLFFAAVMLPEPMTSPAKPKRQVLYGVVVASIAQLIAYPPISSNLTDKGLLPDLFIPALLLGNLLFFKFR